MDMSKVIRPPVSRLCKAHFADQFTWAFLVAQLVENPPAMRETWVWSLGREDPLEKGKATHSSFVAWKIPCTEKPGRLQFMVLQRVGHDI